MMERTKPRGMVPLRKGTATYSGGRYGGSLSQRVAPTRTVGTHGTAIYGGYIQANEKSPRLTSIYERYRTFSNILANISIVAAGVRYFVNLIGGATWSFTASKDDTTGEYAERAEQTLMGQTDLDASSWPRVIRRAAMYRFYGFSIAEWTAAKHPDGYYTFADIAPRPQSTIEQWNVDRTGKVLGCSQRSPQTNAYIYLPRMKIMYCVDDTLNDSPEGLGLFRHLVEPAERLKEYQRLEGIGFTTDLRGIPVVRWPQALLKALVGEGVGSITEAEYKKYEAQANALLTSHIRGIDSGLQLDSSPYVSDGDSEMVSNVMHWGIELLTGGSTSFESIAAAIERLNREMARVIGVEQLLLGSDSVGSHALSADKTSAFHMGVNSTLDDIVTVVKKDLLGRIWQLNAWPEEMMPSVQVESVQYMDVLKVMEALRNQALAGAPLMPDDPIIPWARQQMGAPTPDEEMGGQMAETEEMME